MTHPAASDDPDAPAATGPVRPLAITPLAYPTSNDPGEPVAVMLMEMVVSLAGVMAALDLFRAASSFWIQFSPTPFRGVGTSWGPGSRQMVIGLTLEAVIGASAAFVLAGAVQFFRRRRAAGRLLVWGASVSIGAAVASFAFSLVAFSVLQSAGYDTRSAIILAGWRVRWVLGPMVPPLLLLFSLHRPEIR